MSAALFLKRPVVVSAVRYGKAEDGRWYYGAVERVAAFMIGGAVDAELTQQEILAVVRPTGAWDPPENHSLLMWDGGARGDWLPLAVGDWVIRDVHGEFYPCKPDIFEATYDLVVEGDLGDAEHRAADRHERRAQRVRTMLYFLRQDEREQVLGALSLAPSELGDRHVDSLSPSELERLEAVLGDVTGMQLSHERVSG